MTDGAAVVTVIIPAREAHGTIGRALASLTAQTFDRWQAVVVSDDGGDYPAPDPRIACTTTGRVGAGPSAARNTGLAASATPLVAFLDADDRFHPERLARLVPPALAHGAAADNVAVVRDRDGRPLSTLFAAAAPARLTAAAFLETSVPMFPVCRREIAGRWDEDLRFAEDVAFNLRLLDRLGAIPLCPEALYEYRVRPGSLSAAPESASVAEQAYAAMLGRLAADGFGLSDPDVRQLFGTRLEAKRALNRAFAASGAASFQEFLSQAARG